MTSSTPHTWVLNDLKTLLETGRSFSH